MTPERITELRANTAELGITADDGHIMCDGETWLALLTAAERYLWLRDTAGTADLGTPCAAFFDGSEAYVIEGDELDAAIDAAMKGGD